MGCLISGQGISKSLFKVSEKSEFYLKVAENYFTRWFLIDKASERSFLSYFFVKKYLLVGASSMLWTGQRASESVSESVRDVCMSHQSDRIYYKQPIKFLVLKANGI